MNTTNNFGFWLQIYDGRYSSPPTFANSSSLISFTGMRIKCEQWTWKKFILLFIVSYALWILFLSKQNMYEIILWIGNGMHYFVNILYQSHEPMVPASLLPNVTSVHSKRNSTHSSIQNNIRKRKNERNGNRDSLIRV